MSKLILSLINKSYFILNPRRDNELVVLPQRGGATKELNKIALPFGRIDFDQFLRYFSSQYVHTASSKSLEIDTKSIL